MFIIFILKNIKIKKIKNLKKLEKNNFRKRTKTIDMGKDSRYNDVNNKRRSKEKWLIQKS